MVGIAENIFDKLKLSAGQRVAIVGLDCLGNIIAQVLQYHKIIPIVIDNSPENLEKAKKCGIYYAFPAADEIVDNVMDATSGDLCDAAVYSASSRLPISLPPRLVGKKKSLIFSGFTSLHSSIDACDILEKDLTVFGVTRLSLMPSKNPVMSIIDSSYFSASSLTVPSTTWSGSSSNFSYTPFSNRKYLCQNFWSSPLFVSWLYATLFH